MDAVDRYREVRRLGDRVVLAEDAVLKRRVVIKEVDGDGTPEALRRFRREAKLGASLSHPNLVQVLDAIGEGDAVRLVMEHVPGPSLEALLAQGPLTRERGLEVLDDVAAALDHAHAAGVLHRDVRPSNVLLATGGRAKLGGLGVVAAAESASTTVGGLLERGGALAPELVSGARATTASDVFAFAALAREVLGEGLPPAAEAALAAGAAEDPEERPPRAGILAERLTAALTPAAEAQPSAVTPATRREPRPVAPAAPVRRLAPLAAAAVLLVLAAGTAVLLLRPSADEAGAPRERAADARAETAGTREDEDQGGQSATPSGASARGGPAAAVRAFYERAAADRFDEAWALAAPDLRGAWNGDQAAFEADLASLESITFDRLETTGRDGDTATVAVSTRARHTGYTDTCTGTIPATRSGDGWLVGLPGITCDRS